MTDLLVKLYDLPDITPYLERMKAQHIIIRRPIGPENYAVIEWIRVNFEVLWAGEVENAFFRAPKGIFIAQDDESGEMLGFACYDATLKGFFGPTGVAEKARKRGIGSALLLTCLKGMWDDGYGYAIIGSAGPVEYYQKVCGATVIEDSSPGVYRGTLRL